MKFSAKALEGAIDNFFNEDCFSPRWSCDWICRECLLQMFPYLKDEKLDGEIILSHSGKMYKVTIHPPSEDTTCCYVNCGKEADYYFYVDEMEEIK